MDELVTIGDFSARSGLSPKRLRTYAAGGLLVPRAVDSATGYRYYSPAQVREAQLIDALRDAGMPLVEIGALLRAPSRDRLDAWARRVQVDAAQRQDALDLARQLLAIEQPSVPPMAHSRGEAAMTTLKTAGRSETGGVRDNNEDAVVGGDRLAAVADGMGGHPGGELAAAVAVSLVQAAYTGRSLDELEAAVRAANRAIWDRAGATAGLEGMGTTICAVGLTDDGQIAVVHVGDSRAYLLRAGSLCRLTLDHSVTAELVSRGELSEEQAVDHPLHGCLTRALGVGPDVDLDSSRRAGVPGDRLLLCSDGLFNELSSEEIAALMNGAADPQAAADALVERALSRGARDNVSAVIAEIAA